MSSLYLELRDAQRRKADIASLNRMYYARLPDPRITEPAWRRFVRLVFGRA